MQTGGQEGTPSQVYCHQTVAVESLGLLCLLQVAKAATWEHGPRDGWEAGNASLPKDGTKVGVRAGSTCAEIRAPR